MIQITFNGESSTLENPMSLQAFLREKNYPEKGFAVAVNRAFVPRSQYEVHQIVSGDEIEIVAPMQGG